MSKVVRYDRPSLEIEYDRRALTAPGCCRFVPVVVRLCGIPFHQHVMLTVMFERARKPASKSTSHDDYDVHPTSLFRVAKGIPSYEEYALDLLARGHSAETGTIRITVESPAYNVLSQAVFCLDSRQAEPVAVTLQKGSFKALRFLPRIRSADERDALAGQYPPSADTRETPVSEGASSPQGDGAYPATLFALE
jgi:hypothetical protein